MAMMNNVSHDELLMKPKKPMIMAIWRWPLRVILMGLFAFVTYTGFRAISEAYYNDGFPEALAIKLEVLPIIFPIHMISGGLALLLVPVMLLTRGSPLHKKLGWPLLAVILAAGLTAPFVAWAVPITKVSAAGFTAQAVTWMGLAVAGIWHIRKGNVAAHQNAMLLMAAVTSGAMFFRVYLALFARFGSHHYFNLFYACNAWVAWGLPLIAVFAFCRFSKKGLCGKLHQILH
jgi:Predicted membrane protein (DUF2306)